MREDYFQQPLAQSESAIIRQNEDVGEPRKGRIIRDDPRESDLDAFFVDTEGQRVLDRAFHNVARAASRP